MRRSNRVPWQWDTGTQIGMLNTEVVLKFMLSSVNVIENGHASNSGGRATHPPGQVERVVCPDRVSRLGACFGD